ncbi:MAG: trypsin-like peptidase domain-containing protein [Eubacterium sp.]|nr:trypsin-like peptidase domain-containing protein [Eubacterium sp.]
MSDSIENRNSDPASEEEQKSSGPSPAEERDPQNEKQENTTYSWVNPKLQKGGTDRQNGNPENNPWSGGSDGNYWRYSDDEGQTDTGDAGRQTDAQGDPSASGSGSRGYTGTGTDAHASRENTQDPWGGHGQYRYDGSGRNRKGRKNMEQDHHVRNQHQSGKRWAGIVAMAVVFGLIAGLTTYGVNFVANRLHPVTGSNSEDASGAEGSSSEAEGTDSVFSSSGDGNKTSKIDTTGQNQEMSVAGVAAAAMPSLVTISTMSVEEMQSFFGGTQKYQVQGAGTGVIIGENDTELMIATNNHVVEGATQVSVGFADESVISAQIKGTDEEHDLAVVAVRLSDISSDTLGQIKVATVGNSDNLVLGQQVVAIGNALGYGQSVTSGYISALNRTLELSDGTNSFTSDGLIQTDAAINSGNSGGALLNMKGELVGINEAKRSGSGSGASVDNVGFAIPMAKAEPILENLMNETTRKALSDDQRGYLGITCADVTSEYSQIYHMPEGICVKSVVSGGPADQAGMQKGDVITKFDGKAVTSYARLENRLQYYASGEKVPIVIQRLSGKSYKEHTLQVTLGTSDAISSISNSSEGNTEQDGSNGQSGNSGQNFQNGNDSQDIFGQIFGN